MAVIQTLKKKLRGIRSTQKLTKAMKTISTVKFSKLNGMNGLYAPYSKECASMLARFGSAFEEIIGAAEPDAPTAVVVMASNKGFCGSFNAEVFHFAEEKLAEFGDYRLYACGKKASQYFKNKKIDAEKEVSFGDIPTYEEASALLAELIDRRKRGEIGRVVVIYPAYKNMMTQIPTLQELFSGAEYAAPASSLYLPDQQTLVERSAETVYRAVFFGYVLETAVGAQAATLMTMRAAFDTATEYCAQLEGQINRLRQSAVTADVIETSAEREENY